MTLDKETPFACLFITLSTVLAAHYQGNVNSLTTLHEFYIHVHIQYVTMYREFH